MGAFCLLSHPLNVIKEEEPWYQEGLNFKCTECGQCCTGSPGYIWVTEQEIIAIAAFLNLSIEDFSARYLRVVEDRISLLELPKNYDCIFLKDKKCQIYPVRPKQCRTFPWWPKNLKSKEDWQEAAQFCEGINLEAPRVPIQIIQEQLSIQMKDLVHPPL
jgi:Fe-S-cluster containining protein